MARKNQEAFSQMYLANALEGEVQAWVEQGWPGVTQTTLELFNYWFKRDEETTERFHPCQQRAIETLIYCHEILQAKTLKELFERVVSEALYQHLPLQQEVETILFPKYALKMATGSGKTWVLAALLVWQYFNRLNDERPGKYSFRFLVVTPGHEVLNRLLDSFKGKRDLKTGNRRLETSDYKRPLFMPEGGHWRDRFHLDILEPGDVKPNTTPPDGPFALITNWQQFRLKSSVVNLWDQYTGADVEEMPRGEVIADFLSEYPDLVIMNDEAHHVHGKKSATGEELVWRQFMNVLHESLKENHQNKIGVFLQIDFSATPFYGSAEKREYFPHIIYDYDLLNAMQDMLVKQLFLEQRQAIGGESLEELDFRADRHEPEGSHRRGEIKALSAGQKLLLDIGRKKLEQLTVEFKKKGIVKKPVMMVLCEDTKVADLTAEHPRFIEFYNKLKQQGYVFGSGDTSKETSTGDIIPVDAMTERISLFDIAWPIQVFDEGKLPELSQIDIRRLSPYRDDFHQLKRYLSKLIVQETHVQTGVKTKAWKLDNEYFDYFHFLRQASKAVATRGKTSILSAKQAEIAEIIDSYVSEYCFREQIDFTNPENYQVLNYQPVFDYIVEVISRAIIKLIEGYKFEVKKGIWGKLSDVPRIMLRESKSAVTERSIYPRNGYQAKGGGFESDFMSEVLNFSANVLAFAKLDRRHKLKIPYRDETGILRNYEVDFLVKTSEKNYLVETKADKDLLTPNVAVKARAAVAWSEQASTVQPPVEFQQPQAWEYLILSENLFYKNQGLGFNGLIPLCQGLRDKIIAQAQRTLFLM